MKKKVWLSSLVSSEDAVKKLIGQLKTYGLEVHGHFWEDDLEKMAWMKVRQELVDDKVALWTILASREALESPSIRYGLSLLALTVHAQRGAGFPIVMLQTEGELVAAESLPVPLKGVEVFQANSATLGPKLVAKLHASTKAAMDEAYRLDLYGNQQIGQWFEVGPREGTWAGAMFAVSDGDIVFHGVGPKGSLPSKSVLRYPVQGMRVGVGEKEYTAWAVQNELDGQTSYFVKVTGAPGTILFGPYAAEDDAELFFMQLK